MREAFRAAAWARGHAISLTSQLMIAYMAWPNDRVIGIVGWQRVWPFFLLSDPVGSSLESNREAPETSPEPRSPDQIAFELFGGLRTVADALLSHMMTKLDAIQKRWPRVADILQLVVDIHHEKRAPIPGGASISKAVDVLQGNSTLPRRAQLSKD
jgi:hypothetical protein